MEIDIYLLSWQVFMVVMSSLYSVVVLQLLIWGSVWLCVLTCVSLNFEFFFIKIEYGLYFLDRFDVLMLKIIFKK